MDPRIGRHVARVALAASLVAFAWLAGSVVLALAVAAHEDRMPAPFGSGPFRDAAFLGVVVAVVGVASAMTALAVAAQAARAALGQPWTAHGALVVAGAALFPFLVPAVVLLGFEKRLFLQRGEALPSYALSAVLAPPLLLGFPVFLGVAAGAVPPGAGFLVLWAAFAATRVAFALRLRAVCLDVVDRAHADGARAVFAAFAAEPR